MTVGIVSGRGSGRDQLGRGKVLLLLRSGYTRFTDCSQIPGPFLSTVGVLACFRTYWPGLKITVAGFDFRLFGCR